MGPCFTCVSSCVSLQVESVVESLAAEGAKVALDVAVALHVSVQKSLKGEAFVTGPAPELARVVVTPEQKTIV